MEWLVKNAQSRDVERQHLNKILQEIRKTLNEFEARMARDSTEEARIRAIIVQMLTTGVQSGINVTYNTTSKAIDFAAKTFTIQLTGAVTGTGTVTGLGNVSISTTLNADFDGVEEAPLDGLSYWRNAGAWVTVPFPLETLQFLVPGGILVLDEDLNWYARSIEGVVDEIVVTDGDGIAANPVIGLADLPDANTGTFKLITRDAKGRVEGTLDGDTDDVPEGATNLYYTPTRVYDKMKEVLVAGSGITLTEDDLAEEIEISGAASGGVLPVVTGEVPPVLVYFDDGSLLYAPAEY